MIDVMIIFVDDKLMVKFQDENCQQLIVVVHEKNVSILGYKTT